MAPEQGGFEDLRDRALALFPDALATARRRGARTAEQRLDAAAQRLRDSALTVVVCGEFKRGKSSLLNALLEEDPPLFPVDAAVATSLVTIVSHADSERIMVGLTGRDGTLTDKEISRSEIAAYVTEGANPGNQLVASMVSVETPNLRLTAGVVLVDTPGVGGVFTDHTAATMAYLPGADAIVFVSDFTQPLTATELDFLRQAAEAAKVTGDADALLFVVTKSDLVDADRRAELLANTVAKLAEVTGRPADELVVVPVSSRSKRAWLATRDERRLIASNFGELEAQLWPAVSRRRARVILSAALADLDVAVRALLDPLDTEVTALKADTATKLAELKASAQQRQAELDTLKSERAGWRGELRDSVRRMGETLRVEMVSRLDAAWHRLDVEYLFDPAMLAEPQQLVTRLDAEAGLVAGTISELAGRRAADIQRDFAQRNGLELQVPRIAALPPPPVPPLVVTGTTYVDTTRDRRWDKTREAAQSGSVGGGMGATAGALLGALIGGLLTGGAGAIVGAQWGASLGTLGGTAAGVRKGLHSATNKIDRGDEQARRRSITTELAPLRKAQPLHLTSALNELVHGLTEAILRELDSRIDQQQESLRDAAQRLDSAAKATREQADARLSELEAERRPLQRTRQTVEQLAAAAGRLGRRGPAEPPRSGTADPGWADE
ncbi:dynamin family protein [uncultured Pseudonocardia sp.]|uniref:dynamin family protein n=1 Tax=uncultured Pseudonocardia sp. TaxID=211455 RepID=UPI00262B9CEB|nr:dynamin family protein [uncultured Pseudonocardia sp.]